MTEAKVRRPYPRTAPCAVECRGDGNMIAAVIDRDYMTGATGFGEDLPSALRALADELEREVGELPEKQITINEERLYPLVWCPNCEKNTKYIVQRMPPGRGNSEPAQDVQCTECAFVIATFHFKVEE